MHHWLLKYKIKENSENGFKTKVLNSDFFGFRWENKFLWQFSNEDMGFCMQNLVWPQQSFSTEVFDQLQKTGTAVTPFYSTA